MNDRIAAVLEAIEKAGSQKALAEIAKVPPSFVSQWATERRPVPATKCRLIEMATGVQSHRLRPDVFPPKEPEQPASPTTNEAA